MVYYQNNNDTEYIYYRNSNQSYPVHTHANHITLGCVMKGAVCMVFNGKEHCYHAGESFCILPDVPHELKTVHDTSYSMMSVCIPVDGLREEADVSSFSYALKEMILNVPESPFSIENMAKSVGVSPYHMIRQFKVICGLTPHRFQIQCRVRKAQRLLEEGKSVTEVAYATGFCDQSHFDRCFRKIVRLTPNEYRKSAILH